jgi:GDP-L-fucose synthase
MKRDNRIFVAGHRGMVGAAIVRRLRAEGCTDVVTRTRAEVDLTDQASVNRFSRLCGRSTCSSRPAKVGGSGRIKPAG